MATAAGTVNGGALSRLMGVLAAVLLAVCPAALPGCDEKGSAATTKVKLGGRTFFLEIAADNDKRFRGLSERTNIDPDGGMIFVFPPSEVRVQGFVMRDCPIPIDIVYLDPSGRIVAWHEMLPEPPRDPARGEGTASDPNNMLYNARLKQYSSRFPSQFVIELKGGTVKGLNLKEGEKVEFDLEGLRKAAR